MSFVVGGFNQLPLANAGTSQLIILPTNSVSLDGTDSYDPDGDVITYEWTQVSGPSTAAITDATSATATANNLVVGTYVFELTVNDGELSNSNQVSITVDNTTNISSGLSQGEMVKIYPNPVVDQFIIECNAMIFNDLLIFDIAGNQLCSQKINSDESVVDVSHISSGVYMIKLVGDTNTEIKVIVKQ